MTPPPGSAWRCWRCYAYLGRVVDGVLHEPDGSQSALPAIRRCRCGKRNIRKPPRLLTREER